ncbi:BTB/POZ and MATH domain-containing protein 2 [Brachypodium distachyon]|uniref:BTB domain-containing protein n=1 Tax=Brachypodium distachyon TaxID=15368 RepID=I1I445_BRADI|nr:BTB/POZ and MATH domain-containing protein 2 [Brachypodium distachyon]XP_024317962.1 BTB/POZ and MATH domain-containing protein 2 [Brachypodium distachyon]XP_024317963.1 BTB/POZ and MATH domain-containing protein 2 [Brachypodium distachyon]XP_024317964.1 BTB/POZ and MATH domain-containing protein 2 [Brachypodium distachyon]XP_024317965.1 BTB/POZ and MATH domain-containing protein 2 [Brachypodium distachyon]XP_024317966.1 BTB/POZ and MATH domain-containing protein 2 [Brachypodium distachyon]|eukprot:XP_010234744.1 BTB/POZ and MATH domain-containing protein 2 [Brachypodium distachyon]
MSAAEAPISRVYRSRSRSASAIVAGTVTGHHLLNIEGYSHTKELPTGQYIKSRPFMVGGRLWRIKYYPNGDRPAKADYVSIYLIPGESFAQPVKARVRFGLVDLARKPVPSQTLTTELHSFTANGFGFADFMERKELDMSEHLVNDCFTIRCDVIIYKEVRTEDRSSPLVMVPPSDLHVHFGDLLATKDGADVTFQVAGEMITAHRCVLAARSPVFKAQFFGSMKEGAKSHCIQIEDMMPEVFKNLMHFIYTDSLPEMKEQEEAVMVQHMLEAADRYDMQRLKLICEDKLCTLINVSTAATTLALAEQHSCDVLKQACMDFLKCPVALDAVMETDGFDHLSKICPAVLKELMSKIVAR